MTRVHGGNRFSIARDDRQRPIDDRHKLAREPQTGAIVRRFGGIAHFAGEIHFVQGTRVPEKLLQELVWQVRLRRTSCDQQARSE